MACTVLLVDGGRVRTRHTHVRPVEVGSSLAIASTASIVRGSEGGSTVRGDKGALASYFLFFHHLAHAVTLSPARSFVDADR